MLLFVTFFTVYDFLKLLFIVEKGQGLYCIHCARGERVRLDFFPFFHSYDILGARMLWKPKEARILKNFIDQPV